MYRSALLVFALITGLTADEVCDDQVYIDCIQPMLDKVGSNITNILELVQASPVRVHQGCNSYMRTSVYQCWNDVMDRCPSLTMTSKGEGYKAAMDFMCGEAMTAFNKSHLCLNTKKDHINACFGMFILNGDITNRRLMCKKMDILETCMTEGVTDCGETAVTWTRGFHKVLVGYMYNMSRCEEFGRSSSCTLDDVDACFPALSSVLGLTMDTVYDIVAAPAVKTEEMCISDAKRTVLKCWDDIKFSCDFEEEVKFEADGNMAAIEYICGKGKEDFSRHQACLSKSKDRFKRCYDRFLRNMIKLPPIPMCRNLDIQESCMTEAVKDCGESAVSWTRGFRRYITRYLDRGHMCNKSDVDKKLQKCTVEGILACLQPLSRNLGVRISSFLDLVAASPAKIKDMCMSDTKSHVLTCLHESVDDCVDNTITAHGMAYIGTVHHICGSDISDLENTSSCLKNKVKAFKICVGEFFVKMDTSDRDVMCDRVDSLRTCMTDTVQDCGDRAGSWTGGFHEDLTRFISNLFMCNRVCGKIAFKPCADQLYAKTGLNDKSTAGVLGLKPAEKEAVCRESPYAMACAEGILRNCAESSFQKQGKSYKAYLNILCDQSFRQNHDCLRQKVNAVKQCQKGFQHKENTQDKYNDALCTLFDCTAASVNECGGPATSWLLKLTAADQGITLEALQCSAISNAASMLTLILLFIVSRILLH